jgi:hypothetical protein
MDVLKDIFQRCHKRHAEKDILRQRKTVITPVLYKHYPYHIKVHCARSNPQTLDALEKADISFMPIGHAPEDDRGPRDFGNDRFLKRQRTNDWRLKQWYLSWGIQIYTGIPSQRDGAQWHDFKFKYNAICTEPEAVATCIDALLSMTANPLLTLTKSGGLRFSCRIQDYLHPNTDEAKFFIYKHSPTPENPNHRDVCLEICGDKGYSRWDMRYEILLGNLLEPPVITKEVLFAPINKLRAALHEPESSHGKFAKNFPKNTTVRLPTLGSKNLDLAKEAFLKRGFSYDREENGFHYWIHNDVYVSLWEHQNIVWVRAATPNTEFPTRAMPITDIWDDTGISPPTFVAGLPVKEKVAAVREGNLSPLGLKRLPQQLHKQQTTSKVYKTLKEHSAQLQDILKRDTRILALAASAADILTNTETETYLLNNRATCLNIPSRSLAEAAEERYRSKKLTSVTRWRTVMYRWEQVKDIPVDIRMTNPFQHGNMCEDADRFRAFEEKGGNAPESLCPMCPVYTECQERGYLSQPLALQSAKAQISPVGKMFLDPRHAHLMQQTLGAKNKQERIYIIDERKTEIYDLFIQCGFSKKVVEEWIVNWQGHALGNFAVALMNAIEAQGELYSNPIGRVRAVVEAFQQHEDEIIQQMCYINIQGKVVERRTVDTKTKTELAHYAIDFHGGATAHIPLDAEAEEKLKAMGLPYLPLDVLIRAVVGRDSEIAPTEDSRLLTGRDSEIAPTEDIRIPMRMVEAVALGIYDIQTVEKIDYLPTVCRDPDWTYWHQLQCFFAHYKRDVDAPMLWNDQYLQFWMPPKLHPNVKRLLLISTSISDQQFHRVFPNEEMDVIQVEPTAWVPGNQVFQLRTSSKTLHPILNYDSSLGEMALSKKGERYLGGIRAEIDRDPTIKHAIVTNGSITDKLTDLAAKPNVCFVANFKAMHTIPQDIEPVQVLWIFGTPYWPQRTIWQQAQMLFGNDEKPLDYEGELLTSHYKDERIQGVYNQNVVGLLTQIVGYMGLNRSSGKTVMLLNNFELPDITDRPETLLLDWVDFEVAGGLHNLEEAIRTREKFEAERENLTAETSREEVERVLGCSSRQANRVLQKLRGGNIPRITFREQILFLLSSGRERTTSSLVAAIDASPQSIGNELKRLLDEGEIVRVRRGVYALPEDKQVPS